MSTNAIEFLNAGGYVYSLTTQPVQALPGAVHVKITTRWDHAKDAAYEVRQFSVTLQRHELALLVAGLTDALKEA